MVGYIDNPIVESEIRIRFDDAFDDQFPDRSEFFYAKCACLSPSSRVLLHLSTLPSIRMLLDRAAAFREQ